MSDGRILIAYDGSANARHAIEVAAAESASAPRPSFTRGSRCRARAVDWPFTPCLPVPAGKSSRTTRVGAGEGRGGRRARARGWI
jgi:hypothetical protein